MHFPSPCKSGLVAKSPAQRRGEVQIGGTGSDRRARGCEGYVAAAAVGSTNSGMILARARMQPRTAVKEKLARVKAGLVVDVDVRGVVWSLAREQIDPDGILEGRPSASVARQRIGHRVLRGSVPVRPSANIRNLARNQLANAAPVRPRLFLLRRGLSPLDPPPRSVPVGSVTRRGGALAKPSDSSEFNDGHQLR